MYANDDGTEADALKILHDHGLNYARIRLWVESPDSYHGKTQLLELAKRSEKNKIKLLVDFHYADSWADPGKQPKPAVWENLDFEGLKKALYDHTFDICSSLKDQGTPPDMAQIGNEINNGTLWPDVPGNGWDPLRPSSGNNWENQALFDFNNRALPAMQLLNRP